MNAAPLPGARIIELRVHGVGGSTTREMLGDDSWPEPVYRDHADEASSTTLEDRRRASQGLWRDRNKQSTPHEVWTYLWGRHRPWKLGAWLVLLPFTLVNVAGWAVPPGSTYLRRVAAAVCRVLIAIIGVSLTITWTLWMVIIFAQTITIERLGHEPYEHEGWRLPLLIALIVLGLVGIYVGRRLWHVILPVVVAAIAAAMGVLSNAPGTRVLFGFLAAAAVTSIVFFQAGVNRKEFEQFRGRLGGTGVARERRRLTDEETLASSCFFDHPTESLLLLVAHSAVAVVILGGLALRGWNATVHPDTRVVAEAEPYLGRPFLVIGGLQILLMLVLLLVSAAGSTSQRAGSPPHTSGLASWIKHVLRPWVINSLRAPALAGIGVSLFTAAVGSFDALLRANSGPIPIRQYRELELMPAYIKAILIAVAIFVVLGVFVRWDSNNAPPDDVDALGGDAERTYRTNRLLRSLVEHLDALVGIAGVTIMTTILVTVALHRDTGSLLRLTPDNGLVYRGGIDLFLMRAVGILAVAVPVLGTIAAAVPWRWTNRLVRQPLTSTWDILGFWPRRFHPLGVPPESERAVPEMQSHMLRALSEFGADNRRIVIAAHSQGSVISFSALAGLRDQAALDRMALVTCGSPLFALYPRMFPGQVGPALLTDVAETLARYRKWTNVTRRADLFGIPPGPHDRVTPLLDNVAALDVRDGKPCGHGGYWDDPKFLTAVTRQAKALRARVILGDGPAAPDSFALLRRMVSWFDPRLLATTGYQAGVSMLFGRWADARTVEAPPAPALGPADPHAAAVAEAVPFAHGPGELWIDYVADLGDAFPATFAIAHAVAQSSLDLPDGPCLPRGRILVLGGDEVYPYATEKKYENQTVGPYALASACVENWADEPLMVALPGNHDWYDGLKTFTDLFCTQRSVGRWKTVQTRSYWSIPLRPHVDDANPAWWLWGVDLQLDNKFDHRQRRYFEGQATLLQPGDQVIICSPIPTWTHADADPTAFDVLAELASMIHATQARVPLHLSGDSHHYARYERSFREATGTPPAGAPWPTQYVTAGGGGAFTHPTCDLPDPVTLPVAYDGGLAKLHLREHEWPARKRWKWMLGRLLLFGVFNRSFLLLPAVAGSVATTAARFDVGSLGRDNRLSPRTPDLGAVEALWLRSGLALVVCLLVVVGWTVFAKPGGQGSVAGAKLVGAVHGVAQVVVMFFAGAWATYLLPGVHDRAVVLIQDTFRAESVTPAFQGVIARVALALLSGVLAAVAASVLVGLYLLVSNRLIHMHDNEAAGAAASMRFKHFVRIRISGAEATCFVVAVDKPQDVAATFLTHDPRARRSVDPRPRLHATFRAGTSSGAAAP